MTILDLWKECVEGKKCMKEKRGQNIMYTKM